MKRGRAVRRLGRVVALSLMVLTAVAAPAPARADAQRAVEPAVPAEPAGTIATLRVSLDRAGGDANDDSYSPAISANGRYIAFASRASDLVDGDTNDDRDIFVRDVAAGTTIRVSVDTTGGDANAASYGPVISASGRYVAFESDATDLIADDTNDARDCFVRDVVAGTTTRVTVDTTDGDANGWSWCNSSISASGRYVAFQSYASDLVDGDTNDEQDIFVRDLVAGTTTRVSVDTTGSDPDSFSDDPAISASGRYVAFTSYASDLVEGDGGVSVRDAFVRDLAAGATTRVSVDTTGGDPNSGTWAASISASGRYVAFASDATDLVAGDTNGARDIFVRDVVADITTRVSVDTDGGDANGMSGSMSISSSGRYVAFTSEASDLVDEDGNGPQGSDVFVRDMRAGTTMRVSVSTTGGDPDGASAAVVVDGSAEHIALQSAARNLVTDDRNGYDDIFVVRLRP